MHAADSSPSNARHVRHVARHRAVAVWLGIMAMLTAGLVGFSASTAVAGPPAVPDVITDTPTGEVNTVVVNNGITYVGGGFTAVGANTGSGAKVNITDGTVDRSFPTVRGGAVFSAISDGAGGYYIGGAFNAVNGVPRNRLARILANGQLDPQWNPNANEQVNTLALDGNTVYIGGQFTAINGNLTRNRAAAVDATTGTATDWDPDVNGNVHALAVSNNTVYIGGAFATINGGSATRNRAAAVDATDGTAFDWDPNVNDNVYSLVVSGNTVYIGGQFTEINGTLTRNNLAAVDATFGTATAWNPNANNQVMALAIAGSTLYIGGSFSSIGGVSRTNVAAVDISTGIPTDWNPQANGTVNAVAVSGGTVYLGGAFVGSTAINGNVTRSRLAAVDALTGTVTAWNPNTNGAIQAIAASGDAVYVGGGSSFTHINQITRNRAAAFDANGRVTAWDPNLNQRVRTIVISGTTAYLGGEFNGTNSVNGNLTRNRAAAVDTTTGVATGWNPDADGIVYTMALSGTTMYMGGDFTTINGTTTRNNAAAVDTTAGVATGWNPDAGGMVRTLALSADTVYLGGIFTSINGTVTRNRLAAVNTTDGTATAWNPNAGAPVIVVAVSGTTVYVGGQFNGANSINGNLTRNRAAAVDATTGVATDWNPNAGGSVNTLAVSGGTVYLGGSFNGANSINGNLTRNRLAAVNTTTGVASDWNPTASGNVNAISLIGNTVYAAGSFTNLAVSARASSGLLATTPVSGVAPGQGRAATITGTTLTWTPPQFGGIAQYFVLYRAQGATYPWAIYANGTNNPGISLTNPGTRNTCSAANTAMGWTSCPMVRGWQPGTTYEFAVITRTTDARNSLNPVTPLTTYTVPAG